MEAAIQHLKSLLRYAFDKQYTTIRAIRFAEATMVINALIALGKIVAGIHSRSWFVCVNGFYNVGIAFAKLTAVRGGEQKQGEQRKQYRKIGGIIAATSVVYMIYCSNMAINGQANVSYDIITGIAIAAFTFSEIGIAAYGIYAAGKMNDVTLAATKRINLVTANISLVLTQSALLGVMRIQNATRYCGWVGLVFGAGATVIGLSMVFEARKGRK